MYNTTTRVGVTSIYNKNTKKQIRTKHYNNISGYATTEIGKELCIINYDGVTHTNEIVRKVKSDSIGYSIETDDNIWRFSILYW